jgi:DNA polymerase elongation subunit (family B)
MDFGKPFATVRRPEPRVLDFDTETRPLAVWFDGKCTWTPSAIAWAWDDERVNVIAVPELEETDMLRVFRDVYEQAVNEHAVLTGHNIRDFDLPVLQAAMIEHDLPLLGPVMIQDTLRGLPKMKDMSKSQENLGITLGLATPKYHMSNAAWREANRLTLEGVALTKLRVASDVRQHRELRRALIERGLLSPPRMWNP